MERILTLGQSLLVYILVRPVLPPPGQIYKDKTHITLNKNIPFTLGSNSKTKLNYFGTLKMWQGFYDFISIIFSEIFSSSPS